MHVERYTDRRRPEWDAFVHASKNGTFLLLRGYMDYHRDRFRDHSLLVRDDDGRLLAVLPAHADGPRLVSHGGLTYGGFIAAANLKTPRMLGVFEAAAAYLRSAGFRELVYKTVPHIYHSHPAEEDRYALFLAGACLARREVLAVIDRRDRPPYQQRRLRALQKARKLGLTVAGDADLATFWEVVSDNLRQRHTAQPVHTLAEIAQLRAAFPAHIRLFTCRAEGVLRAGVLVYESRTAARAQYIAATEAGRQCGALDLLFDELLTKAFADKPYFDFGASNEECGRVLNRGLIEQKEGFGARAVAHDHYTLDLTTWEPGRLLRAMR
jgi:hypothetical protein